MYAYMYVCGYTCAKSCRWRPVASFVELVFSTSPFMWILRLELRLSGLYDEPFTHEQSHCPKCGVICKFFHNQCNGVLMIWLANFW